MASKKIIGDYSVHVNEILKEDGLLCKRSFSQSSMGDDMPGGEKNDFKIDWKRIKAAGEYEAKKGERLAYDPDKDGFDFGYEKAVSLRVRISLFRLIRKEVISFNFRCWDWALDEVNEKYGSS